MYMLLQVLSEDCYLDRKNEIPAGKKPYFVLPVFTRHKVHSWMFLSPQKVRQQGKWHQE